MGARETFKEVLVSTLPIAALLFILQLTVSDASVSDLLMTLLCIVLVLIGFTVFLVGVDTGLNPVVEAIGSEIPKRRSKLFMIGVVFAISFLVTVAEPDVGVFTSQVESLFSALNSNTLVYAIAIGVAALLIVAAARIVFKFSLRVLFTICYLALLAISCLAPSQFLSIAFDSGGVTTGPMTVPILLALGIGICSVGRTRNELDGFGMIGVASIGPVLALLIMGISMGDVAATESAGETLAEMDAIHRMLEELISSIYSVALAIIPLTIFFAVFQRVFLKFTWNAVKEMLIGILMASIGAIVFLTAIYTGFIPVATALGTVLADQSLLLILLGALLGFLVAYAEPAVAILCDRVESASGGMVSKKVVKLTISSGVALFVAIGMWKVCYDFNLLYILIPGYILALILMWLCDKDLVGIAFDAGGVATGPMSVAVISTLYTGVSAALYTGTDAVINGFGVIALIALAPIVFLCAFGVYIRQLKKEAIHG